MSNRKSPRRGGRRGLRTRAGLTAALALACLALPAATAAGGALFLPPGNRIFPATIADPALPGFAVRLLGPVDGRSRAEVNLGAEHGLLSFGGGGYQLGLAAGVAARFDLTTDLRDLEVADFSFLVPLDVDFGRLALRAAYLHTSSHLGDDFIERTGAAVFKRVADELRCTLTLPLSGAAATPARLYAGAGYAFNVLPDGSGRARFLGGAELWRGPLFAAADLQLLERSGWKPALTARAGLLSPGRAGAALVFLEFCSGPPPYLAFADRTESRWAIGVALRR